MASREHYCELLENIREADRVRKKAFDKMGSWQSKDQKAVAKARKELDEFYRQMETLYAEHLQPLEKRFAAGTLLAVDEIIEFLAADVPAFKSGYTKEKYYRKLKQMKLSADQIERIREIATQRCASDEYRREDSELRRVMIGLADMDFLNHVAAIPSRAKSRVEGHKKRMLQTILAGRKDLRDQLELMQGSNP